MSELSFLTGIFHFLRDWTAFAYWQSFLFLGASIALGWFFRRSPWKFHLLMLLGVAASVLTPTISLLISRSCGGMLPIGSLLAMEKQAQGPVSLLAAAIFFGSIVFMFVILHGVITARRLIFRARPFPDRDSQEALLEGSKMMRNVSLPILFTSDAVKTPTVWSWGLHPAVLLPETLSQKLTQEERDAIFLHELAHIIRRDHWAALFIRICGIFLFWNPLYWLLLRLSDLAADQACDLLVLSRNKVSTLIYGETLLRLAAGEKHPPILQSLSRKEQLMKRMKMILDYAENPERYSAVPPKGILFAAVVILLLTGTFAICQEKKEEQTAKTLIAKFAKNDFSSENFTDEMIKAKANETAKKLWSDFTKNFGRFIESKTVKTETLLDLKRVHERCEFENGNVVFMIVVDKNNKIAGLFVASAEKKKDLSGKEEQTDSEKAAKALIARFAKDDFSDKNFSDEMKEAKANETAKNLWNNFTETFGRFIESKTVKTEDVLEFKRVHERCEFENGNVVFMIVVDTSNKISGLFVASAEKKEEEGFSSYRVDKIVSEIIEKFPADQDDLSTPEAAYASFARASSLSDGTAMKEAFIRLSIPAFHGVFENEKFSPAEPQWAKVLLSAKVLTVKKYRDEKAITVARFEGENVRRPIDVRYFDKVDGKWLNAGNDRVNLPEEAKLKFQHLIDEEKKDQKIRESKIAKEIQSRDVGKTVSEIVAKFPADKDDLSTPEAAYASFAKAYSLSDRAAMKEVFKRLSIPALRERLDREKMTPGPEWAKMLLSAKVLTVYTFRDLEAIAVAKLEGKNVRNPFDVRYFEKVDGQWLNTGNDRRDSLEEAKMKFLRILNGKYPQDEIPLPEGLLRSIEQKRKELTSAQYRIVDKDLSESQKPSKVSLFRFQGKDQWYVDISELMRFPGKENIENHFIGGCDGKKEWAYSRTGNELSFYNIRDLDKIENCTLSFLDPFSFMNDQKGEDGLEKYLRRQGFLYFGVLEKDNRKVHCFKLTGSQSNRTTTIEVAIDTETLLPAYTRRSMKDKNGSNNFDNIRYYQIEKLNHHFDLKDFQAPARAEDQSVYHEKPKEGYQKFTLNINDGSSGQMIVRLNGQVGEKGTSSSGLSGW